MMRAPRGFTMLELLVAIAILATIFSMVYMSFATTIETKTTVEADNELYAMARLTMDRMSRELSMAYIKSDVRRDEVNLTLFVGEDAESQGYPLDSLHFTSVSHLRYGTNIRESDQNEVSYFVIEDREEEEKILMYREDPVIDEENMAGGVIYELCESIYGINLRYYDTEKEEWLDEWDSREIESDENALPRAVEITLILRGALDEELIFQTKVMVSQ